MMQQGGGQGSEGRHPSSPRGGGSSVGNNSSMPNFSLLGQQMNNFGSPQQLNNFGSPQQQHHHHQNNQYNGNPVSVNFPVGVPALSQQQSFSKVPTNGDNGGDAEGFLSLQNMNGHFASAQTFNQNHQFMKQQMLQQQGPQANLGGLPVASGGVAPEFFMNALNSIQQNILRLQSMVPYMSQNQQMPNLAFQQQAAAAISQIAQVAANMFPSLPLQPQQQQQQQPHVQQQQQSQNMGHSPPRPPLADPHHLPRHHAHHHQQQIQFVGASATQARNAIDGSPPRGTTNSGGSTGGMGNNPFPAFQGGGSAGMSADMGTTATSLPSHIVAISGGVAGNNSSNGGGAGQGLGVVPPKSSPSGGVQNFGGHSSHGASVASPAIDGRTTQQGSPRSNSQMGNGMERGASLAGMAGDMSHNNRVNSGAMSTSLGDDQDGGGARDDDDDGDGENLVPGTYDLVELQAMEILAEHTHFCEICAKGFKRDANLRMHMRGHGDEYKTPAALARPDKASHELAAVRPRRFSCPYVGCKRNQKHRKFQALKTMLCVKNHYRRSHCPKILTCHKCNTKKFSVVADLKTHEKHCGCDKWQCSCGTTFSRKDKLFGHIGLFAGHTPAMPFTDGDSAGTLDVAEMGGGGHSAPMSSPGHDRASGYGLAGGAGSATSMSRGGGSGMGLNGNGVQGLSNNRRGGQPGGGAGGGRTSPNKDRSPLATENSSSSDSFQSSGLLSGTGMLLFSPKFYQATSGANSGADSGLH